MTHTATHFLSWDELHRDSRELARQLLAPQHKQDWKGIICITRGGLIPGAILARELELHLVDTLCISSYDHEQQGELDIIKTIEGDGEGFLLVDDLVDTGATAKAVRNLLPKATFVTLYAKPEGKALSQLFIREFSQKTWLYFPWDSQNKNDEFSYCAPLVK
jgi:xanthine phosphoribosyltransferase